MRKIVEINNQRTVSEITRRGTKKTFDAVKTIWNVVLIRKLDFGMESAEKFMTLRRFPLTND